ncbi:hypothetical protein P7K49_006048, partial [Saguinus oedipus]
VILVSSSLSDRDQSLFLSADEGATFQKQPIPFFVETLIFHPKEEDKILAYTKESKVRCVGATDVLCGAGVRSAHPEVSARLEHMGHGAPGLVEEEPPGAADWDAGPSPSLVQPRGTSPALLCCGG